MPPDHSSTSGRRYAPDVVVDVVVDVDVDVVVDVDVTLPEDRGRAHPALPGIVELLRDGRLHLTSLVELAKVITPKNRGNVIPRFFHTSKREAKEVAAALLPAEAPPKRTVVTTVTPKESARPASAAAPVTIFLSQFFRKNRRVPSGPSSLLGVRRPPSSPSRRSSVGSALHRLPAASSTSSPPPATPSRTRTRARRRREILEVGLDLILQRHAKRRGIGAKPGNWAPKLQPAATLPPHTASARAKPPRPRRGLARGLEARPGLLLVAARGRRSLRLAYQEGSITSRGSRSAQAPRSTSAGSSAACTRTSPLATEATTATTHSRGSKRPFDPLQRLERAGGDGQVGRARCPARAGSPGPRRRRPRPSRSEVARMVGMAGPRPELDDEEPASPDLLQELVEPLALGRGPDVEPVRVAEHEDVGPASPPPADGQRGNGRGRIVSRSTWMVRRRREIARQPRPRTAGRGWSRGTRRPGRRRSRPSGTGRRRSTCRRTRRGAAAAQRSEAGEARVRPSRGRGSAGARRSPRRAGGRPRTSAGWPARRSESPSFG